MNCEGFNEYGKIKQVALRRASDAFVSTRKVFAEWEALRFHERPQLAVALDEYRDFQKIFQSKGIEVVHLPPHPDLTLDAIYVRDALIVSPKGLILCNMGRATRKAEAAINAEALQGFDYTVAGEICAPGTIEGGDLIWLSETKLAVGIGPRTNEAGVDQLQEILGQSVEIHRVSLPAPDHPEDVFHLMSMISPLDQDLALIYRPLMPQTFLDWLGADGIAFVEVPDDEYEAMACNVLALGPREVLMLSRLPQTKARLETAGCRVHTYEGLEISRKGEGGPTCLTRPLVREG